MGFLDNIKNYVFPTPSNPLSEVGAEWRSVKSTEKNLRNYITPVQLQRLRHDVQMWRDAVKEAEQAWYPHRVRMQRMYIDTILSGHTLACVERRKDLTLLRDYCFKNEAGVENEDLKKIFNQKWFAQFLNYALDAQYYGYTLVTLGDLVNDNFPELGIVRRFNISPDRLNVTSYVYALSGAQFLEEPYVDWHVWIPTSTDIGISKVGYGLLYNVAIYEILCRNLLGNNADASELYGMPTRIGTTTKTEEDERRAFESALANMGSSGYILKDALDEVELLETKGNGQGFKIYADFEKRLEAKISKIILGHADALDSTPGKLGASQGEENPAWMAMRDKQQKDGAFLEDVVNDILVPKLQKLGFKGAELLSEYKFCFENTHEIKEATEYENAQSLQVATIALTMKNAGLKMDAKYFEERTGIPTEAVEEQQVQNVPFGEKIKNKLANIYK